MAAGLPLAIALVLTLDFAQAGLLSSLACLGTHMLSRLAHGANTGRATFLTGSGSLCRSTSVGLMML